MSDGIDSRVGTRARTLSGILFATSYFVIASIVVLAVLRRFGHLPRLWDIFVIGSAITAYRFSWRAAAFLYGLSMALAVWADFGMPDIPVQINVEIVRFALYSVLSLVVIVVASLLRVRAGRTRQ